MTSSLLMLSGDKYRFVQEVRSRLGIMASSAVEVVLIDGMGLCKDYIPEGGVDVILQLAEKHNVNFQVA